MEVGVAIASGEPVPTREPPQDPEYHRRVEPEPPVAVRVMVGTAEAQTLVLSVAALVGSVLGLLLAYAAATATRPRWLRSVVTSFSGVAANMGGLPLAFMFLSLLGRQGVGTKILNWAGWD